MMKDRLTFFFPIDVVVDELDFMIVYYQIECNKLVRKRPSISFLMDGLLVLF